VNDERGSISLVIVAALGFAVILGALIADVARASAAKARAQAAADAAALAAVQEQVLPSGRRPADVAAEYAARNGARLVSCRCPEGGAEVVVVVESEVVLPGLGVTRPVRATARAVVDASFGQPRGPGGLGKPSPALGEDVSDRGDDVLGQSFAAADAVAPRPQVQRGETSLGDLGQPPGHLVG
jgi:secretion/DNA translocation related TadE-like protein